MLARLMDAELEDQSVDVTQREAFEIKARRLYGYMKAFADVRKESDWRRPTGAAGRNWKSKVNWQLLDAYDVIALERDRYSLENVDKETQGVFQKQQQLDNYLTSLGSVPASSGTIPHVILATDGGDGGD